MDDDVVSYQLNSLLNEAERPLRPCALCERAPRAGVEETKNPITRLAGIFDAEYASEDMVTLCHHMAGSETVCRGATQAALPKRCPPGRAQLRQRAERGGRAFCEALDVLLEGPLW